MLVQRTPAGAFVGVVLVLILLVGSLPLGPVGPGLPGTRSAGPIPAGAAPERPALPSTPALAPIGPIAGRLFNVQSTLPSGATNSVTGLAVDPSSGLVYAANEFAATITAFSETTGAVAQVQPVGSFAAGDYPAGVLLDPSGHRLFVTMSTRFSTPGAGGWLLVLNESTLATEANISFAAAPHAPFEPTYVAYDAPTDQLFVENATNGIVAEVDLASGAVTGYLVCPVAGCAEHPYGLVDVAAYHTLVVPTCAKALWLVNTSNDSTRALISGPSNGALMAWTAFDTADQIMWVENYSYYGAVGNFLGYNLTTLALVASAPGAPARESGMAYDPALDLLVTTNIDASEAIETYNATTGALVANSSASGTTGKPFLALAVDPRTGVAIAGGPGNDTTIAYALPSLATDRVYASFPATQTAVTMDPEDGNLLLTTLSPTSLEARNESTGAAVWTAALPLTAAPVGAAFDPDNGLVYVADSGSASLLSYSASTGAYQATFPLGTTPSGLCALTVDPGKALLYVGSTSPAEIVAFNVTLGIVVGTFVLTGYSPCRLAVDLVNHELFVLGTPGTSGLFVLAPDPGGLMTERALWTVPASALDLAVSPAGTAYVLVNSGTELVTLLSPEGHPGASVDLTATPATAVALDPVDGLLFLAATYASGVEVLSLASLTVAGALIAPNVVGPIAFDPVSGTAVAGTVGTGQILTAGLVAVPSSPTSLLVTPGNNSLSASWGPPVSSGPDPVTGYALVARPLAGGGAPIFENVTSGTASLSNLTDGTAYNLSVAAVSAAGSSVRLANATATPAGVPYPPTAVSVNGTGATSLTIDWAAPASDDGSPVFDYVVHYVPTAGGTALSIDARNATSVVLEGLAAATEYSISVTAENQVGIGHSSAPITGTTSAAPASVPTWAWVAVGAVVVLAAVVVAIVVVRRRRTAAPPAP